jgi:predicted RNA-binding Zn ribbon-like protein
MSDRDRAPGALEMVREFVNSVDLEKPETDAFRGPASAIAWAGAHGFSPLVVGGEGDAEIEPAELEPLRLLRESLRAELLAHTGDGPAAWPKLATLLGGTGLQVVFAADGMLRLAPRGERLPLAQHIRAAIAAAVYDAVRDGTWARLKACRKHSCRFAFFDNSKNGSGAWCSMAVCGNRVKAERRRARERRESAPG